MTGQLSLIHIAAVERLCVLVQNENGKLGEYADAWLLTAICAAAREHLRAEARRNGTYPVRRKGKKHD